MRGEGGAGQHWRLAFVYPLADAYFERKWQQVAAISNQARPLVLKSNQGPYSSSSGDWPWLVGLHSLRHEASVQLRLGKTHGAAAVDFTGERVRRVRNP